MKSLVKVKKATEEEKRILEAQPTWEHDIEIWNAEYDDRRETFLVISGKGSITLEDGSIFYFNPGDLVMCERNFNCIWSVTEKIKKHYIFDM